MGEALNELFEPQGGPWAEFEFALTKAELRRFYRWRWARWQLLLTLTIVFPVAIFLGVALVQLIFDYRAIYHALNSHGFGWTFSLLSKLMFTRPALLTLVCGPIYWAFMALVIPWCATWSIRSTDEILSLQNFSAFESGFKFQSSRGVAAYPWSEVLRLQRGRTLIAIWASRRAARLLPNRVIGDSGSVTAFCERCIALRAEATAKRK